MKMELRQWLMVMGTLVVLACGDARAYTEAETNAMLSVSFDRVRQSQCDNFGVGGVEFDTSEIPTTWETFLGGDEVGSWTLAEKKIAFDRYLNSLSTADCLSWPARSRNDVLVALAQCQILDYTNSLPAWRNASLNPRCASRSEIVKFVLERSPVEDVTTAYVSQFVTNYIAFTVAERGMAIGIYAKRLLDASGTTNSNECFVRATGMLYQRRLEDHAAASMLDQLFKRVYLGYEFSSNRLSTVLSMLEIPDLDMDDRKDFVAITNQLLSSGQPLKWINVGGNNP